MRCASGTFPWVLVLLICILIVGVMTMVLVKPCVEPYTPSPSPVCANTTSTTLCSSMTVYYSTVTTEDDVLYMLNDVWADSAKTVQSYCVYNVYIAYNSLINPTKTGTITSFTSYYEYCGSDGKLYSNVDYVATFMTGSVAALMSSTTGAQTTYSMPMSNQSNTFCLPMIPIPMSATNIAFGIQMTVNGTTYTQTVKMSPSSTPNYTDTGYMCTFQSNIYDSTQTENSTVLPAVKASLTTALPSGVSLFSTSPSASSTPITMSTNEYRTLLLTYLNSAYSYYDVNLYTTKFSSLKDNPPVGSAMIYYNKSVTPTPSNAVALGCWFVNQGNTSINATPQCYNATSATYVCMTNKMNNFTSYGLNNTFSSQAAYSLKPSIVNTTSQVALACSVMYPVHPYGTFPTSSVTQLSAKVATNPATIKSYSVSTLSTALSPTSTRSTTNYLTAGMIGYLFDNTILFAAGDADGYTPFARECLDIFFGHPDPSGYYHHHFIAPTMTNWCLSNTMRVIGFLNDGYPLVAPFIVKDTNSTNQYRYITTSDLNKYHGLEGSFSFTLSAVSSSSSSTTTPVTLSYSFIYVATFDFPFTASAYYGTPTSIKSAFNT